MAEDRGSVPRTSIVVRTKDRPALLARALADVAGQSVDDWEIVVANDRGDLAAVEEAVAASGIGDRVRVLDVAGAGGRCAAANQGVAAARAEYVVLHDDDDLWHPDFLSRTAAWLDLHPDDVGVAVPTEIRYEERRGGELVVTGTVPFWEGLDAIRYSDLLAVNRMVPISFLYRRAIHDEVGGYDETLDAVEDWEFYLRVTLDHHVGFLRGTVLAWWTQRPLATGEEANSMFALGDRHTGDDARIRDEALRAWVRVHGPGVPLFLAGLIESEVDRRVREELSRRSIARRVARHIPGVRSLARRRRGSTG